MAVGYPPIPEPPVPPNSSPSSIGAIVTWLSELLRWVWELHRWSILVKNVCNSTLQGKLNTTGTVTLTSSASTTTITDARITANSFIGLTPTTQNATSAQTTLYVSSRTNGSAVLTHAISLATDETFVYEIIS